MRDVPLNIELHLLVEVDISAANEKGGKTCLLQRCALIEINIQIY